MSETAGVAVIGFGAGALDVYRQPGELSPDFVPGAKVDVWGDAEDALVADLIDRGAPFHVGGNAPNTLAGIMHEADIDGEAGLAGVLGRGDRVSEAIRSHLGLIGIRDLTLARPGYLPSVSIIETGEGDRMVRGRPRHTLEPHLTPEYIGTVSADSHIVVVSSLKHAGLTQRVLEHAPHGAFTSLNPSSSELSKQPGAVLQAVQHARPQGLDLLALNDEELPMFLGRPADADILRMAEQATEFAENVLCTLGAKGVLLARRMDDGRVETTVHTPEPLAKEHVVDTLGAGDRAHAVAVRGLVAGRAAELILRDVAASTRRLIQYHGAHGDLYPYDAFLDRQRSSMELPLRLAA